MNRERMATEVVGEFEVVVTHYCQIAADGQVTPDEHQEHMVLIGRHQRRLMFRDVLDKWIARMLRRGLDEQAFRAMRRDLTDPYGAMSGD